MQSQLEVNVWRYIEISCHKVILKCLLSFLCRLVNQTGAGTNICANETRDRFKKGKGWGLDKFIKRNDLMDPSKGYILRDTVIIEASLDVYLKQTTTMLK